MFHMMRLRLTSSSAALALAIVSLTGCAGTPPKSAIEDPTPISLPPAPEGSPVAVHGQLQVVDTNLLDQSGQPIQLKGISSMWLGNQALPYAQNYDGLKFMRDSWKLSVVRAAMGTASSSLPVSGAANDVMAMAETLVQNAIKLGVYVLVDWHTEKAVDQKAEATRFFTAMAQKYGAYPNVIWEPYNEPNGYDWSAIKPYHEAVVDAIRAVDPDNIIVMGTPNWSQYVDVAAQDPVAPASGSHNLMYTLHFYACTHTQWLRTRGDTALAKGAPLFITEFGATPADGGQGSNNFVCRGETDLWFDWMATHNISGVAWKLDRCADSSCILNTASVSGPWTDDLLTTDLNNPPSDSGKTQGGGHGRLVVDWLRQ
jgi:endoglucanase